MSRKFHKGLLGVSLPLCLGLPIAQVAAQTTASLEEIIVTAQKREESLQEVPIAVSVLSNESLERTNVTRIEDLGNAVSGVIIENKGGYTVPKVRGIGTVIAGSGVYNAVATYVDDLYIARSYGNNVSIDDAESVQVLKGPQGALYGRNATSGAIVIKTKDPEVGSPLSGKFTVGYAEFDEVSLSGRISSGFGDRAAGSLSAYYKDDDGKRKLVETSQRLGSNDRTDITREWGVNGKLVLEPTDNFRAVIKVGHTEFANRNTYNNTATKEFLSAEEIARINPATAPGGALDLIGLGADELAGAGLNTFQVFMATGVYSQFGLPGDQAIGLAQQTFASSRFGRGHDNLLNSFDLGHFDKVDAKDYHGGFISSEDTYANANLTFNFNRFDLVSITGYRTGTQGSATDVGDIEPTSPAIVALGFPNVGVGFSGQFKTEDIQQELRLQSNDTWNVQWIVGAHYFKEKSDYHWVDGNGFGTYSINTQNTWSNESISAFAQATIPLTDRWSVTVGGRLTEDEYKLTDKIDFANTPVELINPVVAAIGPLGTLKQDKSLETYLARVEYQADEWMVYAGTSTGVKSGSLNNDGPAFGSAKPEKLVAYELGFKSQWFGNSLRVNGALFHYDYKDPHIVFLDTATGGQQLLNASDAEALGFDLDVEGVISDRLTAFFNATILDTEYKNDTVYVNTGFGVTNTLASNGKEVAGAPDFSFVAGLDYRIPVGSMGDIFVSPSVKYSSGNFYDVENRVGTGGGGPDADDGYTLVNLNVRYRPAQGNWSASLWVKNLTDEDYYSSGQVASGFLFLTQTGDPRQIGGSISFEF
jgi:outer membrane receptor protein involved in Fe transport